MRTLFLSGLLLWPAIIIACDPPLDIITHHGDAGGGEGGAAQGMTSSKSTRGSDEGDGGDEGGGGGGGGDNHHDPGKAPLSGGSHKIDGVNDFSAAETLPTSSPGDPPYQGYFSWDDDRLYFGMSGGDIASNTPQRWVLIYIGI